MPKISQLPPGTTPVGATDRIALVQGGSTVWLPAQSLITVPPATGNANAISFGAIADGNTHPLSTVTNYLGTNTTGFTLVQWQAIFSFATSLSNEIDGLAIQLAVNTGLAVVLPSGTYRCSIPLVTNGASPVVLIGSGRVITKIWMLTSGNDGWQHGLTTASSGVFYADDLSFVCSGVGGSALHLNFAPSASTFQPIFRLQNVDFIGAVDSLTDYWTRCVQCNNMPRGLCFRDVQCWGKAFFSMATPAFLFTSTVGSFGYYFERCFSSSYLWLVDFEGTNNPGIEGVTMLFPEAYNGTGLIRYNNPVGSYKAPNFTLYAPGYQGNGTAFQFINAQDIVIHAALIETNAVNYVSAPLLDFQGCQQVYVESGNFNVGVGATHITMFHCNNTCLNMNFLNNCFVVAGQADALFQWDSGNANSNTIRERNNKVTLLGGSYVFLNDASANQISENAANSVGATVDNIGRYTLQSLASGTTDVNSRITITFPTRPVTGSPLFLLAPFVMACAENDAPAPMPTVTVVARTATTFTVQLTGAGSGIVAGINYVASGF